MGSYPRREARLQPTASVIVPTYRRPEQLGRLLAGLLQQDIPSHQYEIIVVADGFSSPCRGAVERLAERAVVSVKYFAKSHGGPAAARAFGAGQARGELLIFVDDDMLIGTDFVREHVAAHREVGPVAVNCEFAWKLEARPESFRRWYARRVEEWTAARRAALWQLGDGLFGIPNVLLTTANISVAREDYDRVGGFDEGYLFSCEDQDFGLRLADAGVRGVVTTRTHATHVETHSTLQKVARRQAMGARDTVRFMRRYNVLDRQGQQNLVMVNDPIKVGVDPWQVLIKKLFKSVIASELISPLVFAAMAVWGRTSLGPSFLEHGYELVVGAHLRKGWCQGRRMYGVDAAAIRPGGTARAA